MADLIINTTANKNASILLNKFALDLDKIVIYSLCGANAKIGRIFRVIPNETPCYMCIEDQLLDPSLDNFRILPDNDNHEIQFAGYNQPGLPGISIDINFIALFTARFTLGTLFHNQNLFPESAYNHFIWQNAPSKISPHRYFDLIYQNHFLRLTDC